MGNLWKMPKKASGIAGFTRDLAYSIESILIENARPLDVDQTSLDKNTGFLIRWSYRRKHYGEVMITKSRGGDKNDLIIDQFWGVKPCQVATGGEASSPEELRNAAQIYDEVTGLLESKFGNPISEHDGRSIYRAHLEQEVVA